MERHNSVLVLDKAIDIVMACARHGRPVGPSELGRILGLPRPTVHRILQVLHRRGWLEKQEAEGTYRLGAVFLLLAGGVRAHADLKQTALPVMRDLWSATGETVNLSVVYAGERVCIEKLDSPHGLRQITQVGERSPLYAGAAAKVFLAHLPEAEVLAVLGRLEPITPATITDPDLLRRELEQVRSQGYAVSVGERSPGITSVSAPVWDHTAAVTASLSVGGPSTRLTPERLPDLIQQVVSGARQLSERLGHYR